MKNESFHEANEGEEFSEKWLAPLESESDNTNKLKSEYLERFGHESEVLFEQCAAYISKLLHDPKFSPFLLKTEEINLALRKGNELQLVDPVLSSAEFDRFYSDVSSAGMPLSIRGISEEYIKSHEFLLNYRHTVSAHSSEEAILSTERTASLTGKDYGSLRQNVNKIEKTGKCSYMEMTTQTKEELRELFRNWLTTQGAKYTVNREKSDLDYLDFFMENRGNPNLMTRLIDFDNKLCGVFLAEIVRPDSAICIINKCLNGYEINGQKYGTSGLSRYLYFKACKELQGMGVRFMNIGSMGSESGTRYNKEILRPLEKMSNSYQISYL